MKGDAEATRALHELLETLEASGGASGTRLRSYLERLEDRYVHLARFLVRFVIVFSIGMVAAFIASGVQIRALERAQSRALAAAKRAENATRALERQADRNTLAIRVSCTLLSNAIIQSGAADSPQKPSTQRRLTAMYITAIVRTMTTRERAQIRRLEHQAAKEGGITLPSCNEVAKHPESVQALKGSKP